MRGPKCRRMNKGAVWLSALVGACALFSPACAKAGEFCPARVEQVAAIPGNGVTYAARLEATSERSVTGQFLLETQTGWYRAPFAPVRLVKSARGIESVPIYLQLPQPAALLNVWLVQAASDDSNWASRGVVHCAPDPMRHVARGLTAAPLNAEIVRAAPVAAPFAYDCPVPFSQAKIEGGSVESGDLAGEMQGHLAAQVDLDADGSVIGVEPLLSSGAGLPARTKFADYVRHLRFAPAVAYCRAVPSTYLVTVDVP